MVSAKYKKSDFQRLTWDEYGRRLKILHQKVANYLQKNKLDIDAIVPVLRGAATAGSYLAYQLHVLRILPVQYKYLRETKLDQYKKVNLTSLADDAFKFKKGAIFLVVENNHCTGESAAAAIRRIKKDNPTAKILYAAVHMDYSHQKLPQANAMFYAQLTNEMRKLSTSEAKEKKLIQKFCLFPWESLEEELAMEKSK